MDPRLEAIAERMIQRCCDDGQLEQAIGIALEARRLDAFERIVSLAPDTLSALRYTLSVTKTVVSRAFREQVLRLVIKLYEGVSEIGAGDWVTVCQCLMVLDDAVEVAKVLGRMLESEDDSRALLAYQIAFDLFDNDMQVRSYLNVTVLGVTYTQHFVLQQNSTCTIL
jgi:26S proteasome regulatory subunit N2